MGVAAITRRWAAGLTYLGGAYAGWQRLTHIRSVQDTVETALSTVANHPLRVTTAGRTDAGVHALQQVIHFDSPAARTPKAWTFGANSLLPPDISVRWVKAVDSTFHARFEAVSRQYHYLLLCQPERDALWDGRATWWRRALDVSRMQVAAQALVGEHDYSAFRSIACQSRSAVRRLDEISIRRDGALIGIAVRGNAFLHHMVRNIVGSLLEVGEGRRDPRWISELLQGRDRTAAGMTAPAEGLYFIGPRYPSRFAIPEPPSWPYPAGWTVDH